MFSSLIDSILNNSFLGYYDSSFLIYCVSVCICINVWLFIFEKLNIEERFNKKVTLYIGCILFGISIIISFKYSMNLYSLFFFIGGMQIGLYPISVLEFSNGDTLGSHMIVFWLLEIVIPLVIYQLFYKI